VRTEPVQFTAESETLILGIGNLLWADEGFGIRCIEALNAGYRFGDDTRLMDGGTQGMFLLPWVSGASRLLIFDAIDFGLPPGELRVIEDDDVPQYMGAKKISMHQTGFQEVLAAAQLLNERPHRLALIGVQPEQLDDYGGGLRACVRRRIPDAVAAACSQLREWDVPFRERTTPLTGTELTGPKVLEMECQESR